MSYLKAASTAQKEKVHGVSTRMATLRMSLYLKAGFTAQKEKAQSSAKSLSPAKSLPPTLTKRARTPCSDSSNQPPCSHWPGMYLVSLLIPGEGLCGSIRHLGSLLSYPPLYLPRFSLHFAHSLFLFPSSFLSSTYSLSLILSSFISLSIRFLPSHII